ncbi:AFR545Wp [Eremothecium gossypii ATCC 10895]|uniref:AFR545Wp n=1 Tax=Eremothecium gossypii (strain ATCC 10895 / CBS 109.51 / FGSC 9923 / NRRL Y-1056) TaxID=284811 RepID=Q752M9_EREGS|nr:AFR545Wp [Eremothecium gossypii ATCC 10895]AAS53916.1 AFR545Wp [Eremothecium gossypii ATCC 10895]
MYENQRHLTAGGRNNPFLDQDELQESRQGSTTSLLQNREREAGATESDYQGYYAREPPGVRGEPSKVASSRSLNSMGVPNSDIMTPPAFDRYPMVGSRVASMALPQGAQTGRTPVWGSGSASEDNSMSSLTSSNPFLGDQDFSPFGGYPASSFPLLIDEKEDDDYLHNPDPEEESRLDKQRFLLDLKHMDKRSAGGFVGILLLFIGGLMLFIVLPVLTYTGAVEHHHAKLTEVLSPYQYPQLSAIRTSLVDPDTPKDARKRKSLKGETWPLVFSDEFNAVGRTFFEGDDQFWTGPNIHYAATNDLEWYTPDAATTKDGVLQLRMDAFPMNGLYYRSGMLQSWNKMCYTQGVLEISANLPNYGQYHGLWPGLWTMGNLGRPGFLASTEGVWPYSYEACDAGITPNQSSTDGISYLPGQKLSSCTCDGEDHPNPGVGRGAPEIDLLEGAMDDKVGVGTASQSLQVAPYDIWYIPDYDFIEIYNHSITAMNTYCGGPFQQAVSAVSTLNRTWYQFGEGAGYFQRFSLEYMNDEKDGYITWYIGDKATFTIYASALHPNGNVDWRRISKEPMSIILNLGISNNWAYIDWANLYFPVTMSIDYVRLYQPSNAINVNCDPPDYPTYDYIQKHLNAYMNPNLTSWEAAGYTFPKNILTGNCKSSKFRHS